MTYQISKGIIFAMLGAFWFSVSDLFTKSLLDDHYPQFQIVFFRAVFAFIPLAIWLFYHSKPYEFKTYRPLLHIVRAIIGYTSIVFAVYGLSYLPIADYTAIMFVFPLMITALSVPILGEKVGYHRWLAVCLGFFGVLLIVQPGYIEFNLGVVFCLGLAFALGLISVMTRWMTWSESTPAILFWYLICHIIFSIPFMFFGWKDVSALDLFLLAMVGVTTGIAQIFVNESFRLAPPSISAPYTYTSLIWAIFWGVIIWGTYPTLMMLAGSAVIVGSGIYIAKREGMLSKKKQLEESEAEA